MVLRFSPIEVIGESKVLAATIDEEGAKIPSAIGIVRPCRNDVVRRGARGRDEADVRYGGSLPPR